MSSSIVCCKQCRSHNWQANQMTISLEGYEIQIACMDCGTFSFYRGKDLQNLVRLQQTNKIMFLKKGLDLEVIRRKRIKKTNEVGEQ